MQLQDMLSYLYNLTDYSPENADYKDELISIINQNYINIFLDKPWNFAQKEAVLTCWPDETLDVTITIGDATVAGATSFPLWCTDQIIEIDSIEYTIKSRVSSSEIELTTSITGSASGTYSAIVKHRYIDMPRDCISILEISRRKKVSADTNEGSIIPIERVVDEHVSLDMSTTGMPTNWIPYDDIQIPSPVRTPSITSNSSAPTYPVPVNGTYKAFYTFYKSQGGTVRESGPSPIASLAAVTTSSEILLTNMQNTGASSGLKKYVYYKTPESNVYRRHTGSTISETTTTLGGPIQINTDYLTNETTDPRYFHGGGSTQRVRLHPRQDEIVYITVRYIYQPPHILEDTDSPEMPNSAHMAIVYKAMEEVLFKQNNVTESRIYADKAERELIKLSQRFLSIENYETKKGSWSNSLYSVNGRGSFGPFQRNITRV